MSKPKLDKLKEYLQFRIDLLKHIIESMPKYKRSEMEMIFTAKLDALHEVLATLKSLEEEES